MSDKIQEALEELELYMIYILILIIHVTVIFSFYDIRKTPLGVSVTLKTGFPVFAASVILTSAVTLFLAVSAGALAERKRAGGQPGGSGGPAPGAARPPEES